MTADFDEYWGAIGLDDEDLRRLQNTLLDNPKTGSVIPGGNGTRKMRYAIGSIGKRGGVRVIYLDVEKRMTIYLLIAYPKSVKADLTPQDKKAIGVLVNQLKECEPK
jgi:hypothetical protein